MDFKFDVNVPRDSPDPLKNFFEKLAWPGSRVPVNFGALNANSSKTVNPSTGSPILLRRREVPTNIMVHSVSFKLSSEYQPADFTQKK